MLLARLQRRSFRGVARGSGSQSIRKRRSPIRLAPRLIFTSNNKIQAFPTVSTHYYLDPMNETPEQAAERRHKYLVRCLTVIQVILIGICMNTCTTCMRIDLK